MTSDAATGRWLLLSGGVGGAKLALGLDRVLPAGALSIVTNTGDDFRHLGLAISPDIDTLLYTLSDQVNAETGWGRRDESWGFMAALAELGGETWFRLGDRDLALHVERTRRLAAGETLTAVTADIARRFGLQTRLLPMSDARAPTQVATAAGLLEFQDYFVRRQAAPVVSGFRYGGGALPATVRAACTASGLRAVLVAPSNPWLSIAPILAVPGLRAALRASGVPVIAVSPIVGGAAIKGPTAKIMGELGLRVSALAVAEHYGDVIDGYVIDAADRADTPALESLGLRVHACPTVMRNRSDQLALARAVLAFAATVPPRS
jgi:LPPG:FO 2-phospho-L-lactate transferase